MTIRTVWRIAGTETAGACDVAALHAGLRLHLQHGALTSVAVQLGPHQRVYVALAGCAGCAAAHGAPCAPGCHADLLRRLLGATWPGVTLARTQRGVLARPYTRSVMLVPTPDAQPWSATQLAAWPDARLILHWPQQRAGLAVAGLLAVGADGPDPVDVLTTLGWTMRRMPRPLCGRWATQPLPPVLPGARAWPGAPLLVPLPDAPDTHRPAPDSAPPANTAAPRPDATAPAADAPADDPPRAPVMPRPAHPQWAADATTHAAELATTTALAEQVATALAPLILVDPDADDAFIAQWLDTPAAATAPQISAAPLLTDMETVDDPDESIWPHGPGTMRPVAVGALMEQLRTSPVITTGDTPGVSRKRLVLVLPDEQAEYARHLLVWLDRAGLLHPPALPAEPFRAPRPLVAVDDADMAARLAATPVPSSADARAATQ